MRIAALALIAALGACHTISGDEMGSRAPAITAHSNNAPDAVAACIQSGMPGIYIPSESRMGGTVTVSWHDTAAGVLATFTIAPASTGSDVAVRMFSPLHRQVEKVAHCYAG